MKRSDKEFEFFAKRNSMNLKRVKDNEYLEENTNLAYKFFCHGRDDLKEIKKYEDRGVESYFAKEFPSLFTKELVSILEEELEEEWRHGLVSNLVTDKILDVKQEMTVLKFQMIIFRLFQNIGLEHIISGVGEHCTDRPSFKPGIKFYLEELMNIHKDNSICSKRLNNIVSDMFEVGINGVSLRNDITSRINDSIIYYLSNNPDEKPRSYVEY